MHTQKIKLKSSVPRQVRKDVPSMPLTIRTTRLLPLLKTNRIRFDLVESTGVSPDKAKPSPSRSGVGGWVGGQGHALVSSAGYADAASSAVHRSDQRRHGAVRAIPKAPTPIRLVAGVICNFSHRIAGARLESSRARWVADESHASLRYRCSSQAEEQQQTTEGGGGGGFETVTPGHHPSG